MIHKARGVKVRVTTFTIPVSAPLVCGLKPAGYHFLLIIQFAAVAGAVSTDTTWLRKIICQPPVSGR